MPFNLPGVLVPFHLLVNPRLIIPAIVVKDIRQIDFPALRKAGYRGAVFDKDNCLTIPHEDRLIPELTEAWKECRETFGKDNVLVVSNSAGSHLDSGEIQAESVSYHLGVPVLRHPSFKPSYSCVASIRAYFNSLPSPVHEDELIVVGDRVLTDVVLANRMARKKISPKVEHPQDNQETISEKTTLITGKPTGPLAILTERVWQRDNTMLRWIERGLVRGVEKWVMKDGEHAAREGYQQFVKPLLPSEAIAKQEGLFSRLWRTRRS